MRVIIGGFSHHTNTFSTDLATLESYQAHSYARDNKLIETFQNSDTAIGGFLAGANMYGFDTIPTLFAQAPPSGPTPRPVFDHIAQQLINAIEQAGAVDGVLLQLYGGTAVGNLDSADGLHDPEGYLLQKVRDVVGTAVPIVACLDIHANVSQQMAEMADVLIGGETFPEVDLAARGRECVEILWGMKHEGSQPTTAVYPIQLIWGANKITSKAPMQDAIAYLHDIEDRPGVIKASLALGNPLADVVDMGAVAYVVTENNLPLAQQYAKELGIYCHVRRKDWHDAAQTSAETVAFLIEQGYPLDFSIMTYRRLGRKLYPINQNH